MKNRIYSLDYLRGICAFLIMLFHYLTWSNGELSSNSFLGRVGLYGVSIFYMLSGLTLFLVYKTTKFDFKQYRKFIVKRIFRIFPLLWFVIILTILGSKKTHDFYVILLNVSGLYGFLQWDKYIGWGTWSIGNEIVFYSIFPLIVILSKVNKSLFYFLIMISVCLFLWFTFYILPENIDNIEKQWKDYVNPLNNSFLFIIGCVIGNTLNNVNVLQLKVYFFIVLALMLFTVYPCNDSNRMSLVVSWNRIVFTSISFIMCVAFYKLEPITNKYLHNILVYLGELSYSIYLIHPIVWAIKMKLSNSNNYVLVIFSIIVTLIISKVSYNYIELYGIEIGKKLIRRFGF